MTTCLLRRGNNIKLVKQILFNSAAEREMITNLNVFRQDNSRGNRNYPAGGNSARSKQLARRLCVCQQTVTLRLMHFFE